MPRLYGLMIVKNEADIIDQSLLHALSYCEKIIVMDNMSGDGTWDIVGNLASTNPERIIPHCRLVQPFDDGLRAIAYNAFHAELSAADWWLRLDADEFLNESPAPLLRIANDEKADFIRANQMQFALTDLDVAAIGRGEDSRAQPIERRRRHYRVNWREFRFFRNDPAVAWDAVAERQFPQNLSKSRICSRAIYNRHYPVRDIEQLEARIAIRRGSGAFAHVGEQGLRSYVQPAATHHVWAPGAPVEFSPLTDFWIPRIRLEFCQRLGLAAKPA